MANSYSRMENSRYIDQNSFNNISRQVANDPQLSSMQGQIHKEIDEKLKLEMEKREMELMLENEFRRQDEMSRYYQEQKRLVEDEC